MPGTTWLAALEKLTLLLAAHGVFALTVIFIFYQQRRAYRNFREAQQPDDRKYFRRVHAATVAATFALTAAASGVWWFVNYSQRPVVWGVITNLRNQARAPVKEGDPPMWVHTFLPESPELRFYEARREMPPFGSGEFQLAWAVRAESKLSTVTFAFQQQYVGYRTVHRLALPTGRGADRADREEVLRRATVTLNLEELGYSRAAPINLIYAPDTSDALRNLGRLFVRRRGQLVPVPWDDLRPLPPSAATGTGSAFGALQGLLVRPLYAQQLSKSRSPFREDGSYDAEIGRMLRVRLGSFDRTNQLSALWALVEGGTRSIPFIRETLAAHDAEDVQDPVTLLNNLGQALELIETRHRTSHPDVAIELARALYMANNFDGAAQWFAKGETVPLSGDDLYFRGYAYFQYERYDAARRSFDAYLAETTDQAAQSAAYTMLGLTADRVGDVATATRHYRRALQLDPRNDVAMNNLAYVFAERGENLDEGLALVDRALRYAPNNPHYLDTKGWLLSRYGRHQEALALIERAARAAPENAEIREHLKVLQALTSR